MFPINKPQERKDEAEASPTLPGSLLIGAGHDRVPAETERDQLPNCQ
jgi:hypothetical protein